MKTNNILSLATAAALTLASSGAFAVATIGAGTNTGAAGATVTIPVTYNRPAGDANSVFSATFRIGHTNPPITFVSFSSVGATPPTSSATTCNANGANTQVTCVLTTNPPTGIAVGNYTLGTITYQIAAGAAAGAQALVTTVVECTDINGDAIAGACNSSNGTITVGGGGPVPTPPNIAYAPATSTTITYAGAGTAAPIVATPSGGAGTGAAATTTVGACTITGGGAAFPTTSIAQLSFVGATVTPQNLVLPNCAPQAAQVDATLTCPQALGAAAATNQVWTLRCPAAAVGAVPPVMSYNPAPGSTTNVAAGAQQFISVGCPTDGSPCTGSGTGLDATTRLESLSAAYTGLASPSPTMACAFVNEAGGAAANPLDFVALTADPGDIRCTCPANTTNLPTETFRVTVQERRPASGAVLVARTFDIVCGAPPPVCGTATYVNQASGATINLTNGGAASPVSTVSLVGASNGVSQTITCATSNVSAGSTFTVTTTPAPLVISTTPTLGGTISAACTNTAQTAGSATVTCTGSSATPNCASTATFTLTCPGQGGPQPPPTTFVPVPAMGEQGRILLAALVLLMGLGVVGFRMRG